MGRDSHLLQKLKSFVGTCHMFVMYNHHHEHTYTWEKTQVVEPAGLAVTEVSSDYFLFSHSLFHLPSYSNDIWGESSKGLRKIYAWKPTWRSVTPTLPYELLVSHYWILLVEYFVLSYRMLLFCRDSLRRTSLKQKWSLLQDQDLKFYKAKRVERWLHYQQTTI